MAMFDSPVGRCEVAQRMVLLDQTQQECAHEHHCSPDTDCPLDGCFAEESGISAQTLASMDEKKCCQENRLS